MKLGMLQLVPYLLTVGGEIRFRIYLEYEQVPIPVDGNINPRNGDSQQRGGTDRQLGGLVGRLLVCLSQDSQNCADKDAKLRLYRGFTPYLWLRTVRFMRIHESQGATP
jgi:hypothetical protein